MIVGVIGSGSIGPDLAYGFVSALAKEPGSKVYLNDIRQEALDAGMARIMGYVKKGVDNGKLAPKVAQAVQAAMVPTMNLADMADCEYVLEAASENLDIKRVILKQLEEVVSPDCLIGFATSGIPRKHIARDAKYPDRCFVNHPFFPAWRTLPIEIVLSPDKALGERMIATMKKLGKVPVITADVECFAADDVFCNYITEAVRMIDEGLCNEAQVDKIVNDHIGGGGPLNVMDLTGGNLLVDHCQQLMEEAPTGSPWFRPPALLKEKGNQRWHDRKNPQDSAYTPELAKTVMDRIYAVILARTYFIADNKICEPGALDWLLRMSLGFNQGLLSMAEDMGMERVRELCVKYAANNPGFEIPVSIQECKPVKFLRNVVVEKEDGIATITICRPEVMNALSALTVDEIYRALQDAEADDAVQGVVLTSFGGSLAGADINELAVLPTPEACEDLCLKAHDKLTFIARMKKPVVIAVDGAVLGGGAELSMCCDARVVGPNLMLGQPEVNLGIIPGYGGTQRLPRLVGLDNAMHMLRSGAAVGAKQATEWGWATGAPAVDFVGAARKLVRQHIAGEVVCKPVDPTPMDVPRDLPLTDIGHRSLAIDAILVDVVRRGLALPLEEGLKIEANGFGRCKKTVDMNIGMTNFIVNGPRVPAAFMHE